MAANTTLADKITVLMGCIPDQLSRVITAMPSMQKIDGRKNRNTPQETSVPSRNGETRDIVTLSIDIGGSGIKTALLNSRGQFLTKLQRITTPEKATPEVIIKEIERLAKQLGAFDRIAVGFPGVVQNGVTRAAPNLAMEWKGYDFGKALSDKFSKPVRVINDADMQGFGAISGKGVELMLTLGTGVGSALFIDGRLVPNLEVGEDALNRSELKKKGKKRWNKRLIKTVRKLEALFNYDRLYIGGGNAKHVNIEKLPGNVQLCSNLKGVVGGAVLWRPQ
jgi:polyphosphate glucokinase